MMINPSSSSEELLEPVVPGDCGGRDLERLRDRKQSAEPQDGDRDLDLDLDLEPGMTDESERIMSTVQIIRKYKGSVIIEKTKTLKQTASCLWTAGHNN